MSILPNSIQEDYFYLCISMTKKKIICVYGVATYKNISHTNTLKYFIFFGKLIATIIMLFLIIILKK